MRRLAGEKPNNVSQTEFIATRENENGIGVRNCALLSLLNLPGRSTRVSIPALVELESVDDRALANHVYDICST
jgi:hypothetical protein